MNLTWITTGVGRASLSCVDIDFSGGNTFFFNPLTVRLLYVTMIRTNRVKLNKYDEYILFANKIFKNRSREAKIFANDDIPFGAISRSQRSVHRRKITLK